jgi:hypothetical protein
MINKTPACRSWALTSFLVVFVALLTTSVAQTNVRFVILYRFHGHLDMG